MGALFRWKCENCDYEAEVSGGRDRGFIAVTETMVCRKCSELVDVLVSKINEVPNPLYFEEPIKSCCPKCKGTNLTDWNREYLCLKCGNEMTADKSYKNIYRHLNWECKSCGYFVSAPNEEELYAEDGLKYRKKIMVCLDCSDLVYVNVNKYTEEVLPMIEEVIEINNPNCPRCGNKDLTKWETHLCPKCSGKIEAQKGAIILWD